MKKYYLSFFILFLTWVVLTWSLSIPELLLGLIACLITVYATASLYGDPEICPFNPLKFSWLLLYAVFLIWDNFKASLNALINLIRPAPSGKAVFIEVKITLKNGTAVGLLMNALTLTTGLAVVSANSRNSSIGIHLISSKGINYSSAVEAAVSKYENILKKVFE
jgi:multicomponent Na+:H+ antiporter subunit E